MKQRSLLHVLSAIVDQPWAIRDVEMQTILGVVEAKMAGVPIDIEAVAAKLGRPLENTGSRVEMRGDVAVISVAGPIFRYADIFSEISGATSVEHMATDFQAALDNSRVDQILLNIDSPGGEVNGISDFADMVRAGSQKKPVTAFVDGLAASAAYWIASAATRVVASKTSLLGSIGVVVSMTDRRAAQERQGVKRYEVVSTVSPKKRLDISTDEGQAQVLAVADQLAEIFVGNVARFRGTTRDNVVSNFGQGGVLIARDAVAAGMADQVGTFESLLGELARQATSQFSVAAPAAHLKEVAAMADLTTQQPPVKTPVPEPVAPPHNPNPPAPAPVPPTEDPAAQARAAERARIEGILCSEQARGRKQMARHLAFKTDHDVAAAVALLAVTPAAAPQNPLEAAMGGVQNPKVGTGVVSDPDSPASEAARILQFVPKGRRAS
jgi:ClpP class serine protease